MVTDRAQKVGKSHNDNNIPQLQQQVESMGQNGEQSECHKPIRGQQTPLLSYVVFLKTYFKRFIQCPILYLCLDSIFI